MSIKQDVKQVAVDTLNGFVRTIDNRAESRRLEPEYWAEFHGVQYQSLPRWRWLARAIRLAQSRRFHSHAVAKRRSER